MKLWRYIVVIPAEFTINGADNSQRLLVSGSAANGNEGLIFDYSRKAAYSSSDPKVATVSTDGVVTPQGNGSAEIRISFAGKTAATLGSELLKAALRL